MAANLLIMRPLPIAASASAGGTNPAFCLTPTPKEAWSIPANTTATMDLDLGSAQDVDTFFVGYHTAAAISQTWKVEARATLGGTVTGTPVPTMPLLLDGSDAPTHGFFRSSTPKISTPVNSRYWRFTFTNPTGQPTLLIPVLALGLSFQPTYGHEYGAGRPIGDTGTTERLFGGDFALDPGAVFGGYSFTMGDLSEVERKALYRYLRKLGTSRSLLVVEDPEVVDELNDRLHWCVFAKIEAYERYGVGVTRWSLKVDDWA